jgi:alpha-beta hydrolase superfamily lysophospholipase
MPEQHLRIPVGNDQLDAVYHRPDSEIRGWVVSFHGLESNKEGSKPIELANRLLPHGIGVVRFDFRGCGQSTGRFADTNVQTRLDDARAVISALAKEPGGGNLGLFGSSMGGFVGLFLGADPGLADRVRANVALAAPSNLDDLVTASPDTVAGLKAFIEEYQAGKFRRIPPGQSNVLLLHGDADEVVPVAHCDDVWQGLAEPRERRIFSACDHRFSNPTDLSAAMDEAAAWILRFLASGQAAVK